MKTSNIHYNTKSNIVSEERLNPGLSHSRYVHLKLLKKHVKRLIDENLVSGKKIKLADMGCGELPYLSMIKPHVHEYIGIDLPGNKNADIVVDPKNNRCNLEDNSYKRINCAIAITPKMITNNVINFVTISSTYLSIQVIKSRGEYFHPRMGDSPVLMELLLNYSGLLL